MKLIIMKHQMRWRQFMGLGPAHQVPGQIVLGSLQTEKLGVVLLS